MTTPSEPNNLRPIHALLLELLVEAQRLSKDFLEKTRVSYVAAGAPYGPEDAGMWRWFHECNTITALRTQADKLEAHHRDLREMREAASTAKNTTFTAVFQKDNDWIVGWIEELPGAISQERTLEDARESLKEAARLILDGQQEISQRAIQGPVVARESIQVALQ